MYSCWYSHCICTAVGTVTVYVQLLVSHCICTTVGTVTVYVQLLVQSLYMYNCWYSHYICTDVATVTVCIHLLVQSLYMYNCWFSHCICTAVGTVTVYVQLFVQSLYMYSCWYSPCICTTVGTVTVYVQLLLQSLYMKMCIQAATLPLPVTAAVCPRTVCNITSLPKDLHLVFPFAVLHAVSHCNVPIIHDKQTPHISSETSVRQPMDGPSHTARLAVSLNRAATFCKNSVCRNKISLNNTANIRIT
jgi:hypothetical protein